MGEITKLIPAFQQVSFIFRQASDQDINFLNLGRTCIGPVAQIKRIGGRVERITGVLYGHTGSRQGDAGQFALRNLLFDNLRGFMEEYRK